MKPNRGHSYGNVKTIEGYKLGKALEFNGMITEFRRHCISNRRG